MGRPQTELVVDRINREMVLHRSLSYFTER